MSVNHIDVQISTFHASHINSSTIHIMLCSDHMSNGLRRNNCQASDHRSFQPFVRKVDNFDIFHVFGTFVQPCLWQLNWIFLTRCFWGDTWWFPSCSSDKITRYIWHDVSAFSRHVSSKSLTWGKENHQPCSFCNKTRYFWWDVGIFSSCALNNKTDGRWIISSCVGGNKTDIFH